MLYQLVAATRIAYIDRRDMKYFAMSFLQGSLNLNNESNGYAKPKKIELLSNLN